MEAISLVECVAVLNTVDTPSLFVVSTDWLLIALLKHGIVIAVQKSCIHASAVAVFVEWWIVSFHRGICTLGAIFLSFTLFLRRTQKGKL